MKIQNIHNKGRQIFLFGRDDKGKQTIVTDNSFYPFFFDYDEHGEYHGYDGTPLKKVIVNNPNDIGNAKSMGSVGVDVPFKKQYMIHRIDAIEKTVLKYFFLDIEVLCDELPDTKEANLPISCISIYNSESCQVKTWWLPEFPNEAEMLADFCSYIQHEAPDMLLAWNMSFDYAYLHNRIKNFSKKISPVKDSRGGDWECFFPAGISIIDYMGYFKKVFMREASYALNNVCQKYLNDADWGSTDFSKLTEDIKKKNINDIKRMVKLEKMFHLLNYFDEIRRLTKVQWEDLYHNSTIVEMLLFDEAKRRKIVLPNRQENIENETFEGAIRDTLETGALFNIGKYDLTSAYPSMIINFCLDFQNIRQEPEEDTVDVGGVYFKQNPDTIVPTMVKKALILKDQLKKELKECKPDAPEYKEKKTKYDAIKGVINSCFGAFGNQYFRLYDQRITSAITFLVRELLTYTKNEIEQMGSKVVYYDTDSLFCRSNDNAVITDELNECIQRWGEERYDKKSIDLKYEHEGSFDKLFLLTKCRYVGYLNTGKNIIKEIKGVEIKRVSSTKYEAFFQESLINKILDKVDKNDIELFIKGERERIKTLPLEEVAFPCKLQVNREYKNTPIFVRAVENSRNLFKAMRIGVGELFYYVYVKKLGHDKNGKELNVIAFNKGHFPLDRSYVDWELMINRNIETKVDNIYEAMHWINRFSTGQEIITLF